MITRYSPSLLNDFEKCPYFFKIFYLDGRKKELEKPKPYYTLGRTVHEALCKFFALFIEERTLEKLHDLYRQSWKEIIWEERGFENKEKEKEYGLRGLTMLEWFCKNYDLTVRPKYLENFCETTIPEGITLVGKIDRIDEHPDTSFTIVDYKTGKGTMDDEKMPDDLQAGFYTLLVEKKLRRPIKEIKFIYLESKSESSFTPDDGYVEKVEEGIKERIANIENMTEFLPKVSYLCKYCDVLPICPEKINILREAISF